MEKTIAEAVRLLEQAEFLAGARQKDAAPYWRQFREEARAVVKALKEVTE